MNFVLIYFYKSRPELQTCKEMETICIKRVVKKNTKYLWG